MDNQTNLPFNPKASSIMHIDLNSCFATIEQQANPSLRGKPIAVAAYSSPNGCVIAPSVEAKALGIKVGMRVKDAKFIYPSIAILTPDPWKYRAVHLQLREVISSYTSDFVAKSIDEFVLNLEGYPAQKKGMVETGLKIKKDIKENIGEWMRVSIGYAPNRFLAKQAAGLKKPDGLEEIACQNYQEIYKKLTLMDLSGIDKANTARLNSVGIFTVLQMLEADVRTLKSAFNSILGYYWYLRLRGWEIDDVQFARKSYGAMYSLGTTLSTHEELAPILHKLVCKTANRMRTNGYYALGVHLGILYRDRNFWHHGHKQKELLIDSRDIYKRAFKILVSSPYKGPVANLAVSVFDLTQNNHVQTSLFENMEKKISLASSIDKIQERYGDFVITPGIMLGTKDVVLDRIGFGNIKDLESLIVEDQDNQENTAT